MIINVDHAKEGRKRVIEFLTNIGFEEIMNPRNDKYWRSKSFNPYEISIERNWMVTIYLDQNDTYDNRFERIEYDKFLSKYGSAKSAGDLKTMIDAERAIAAALES